MITSIIKYPYRQHSDTTVTFFFFFYVGTLMAPQLAPGPGIVFYML